MCDINLFDNSWSHCAIAVYLPGRPGRVMSLERCEGYCPHSVQRRKSSPVLIVPIVGLCVWLPALNAAAAAVFYRGAKPQDTRSYASR